MLLLYAKYAFIFWLVIGNHGNMGDIRLVQQITQDMTLFAMSACTAYCLQQKKLKQIQGLTRELTKQHRNQVPYFRSCFELCSNKSSSSLPSETATTTTNSTTAYRISNSNVSFRKVSEHLYLTLICRSDTSFSFRISKPTTKTQIIDEESAAAIVGNLTDKNKTTWNRVDNKDQISDVIYIVKINVAQQAKEALVYLSDEQFFTLKYLNPNTMHNVTVLAMHGNRQYATIAQEVQYKTLRRNVKPNEVSKVEIVKYLPETETTQQITARLQWKPAADLNCYYDIFYFSTEEIDFDAPIEYRDPRLLYHYDIRNLNFSGEYKVGVRSVNAVNYLESDTQWVVFRVPSCNSWYNYNYTLCAPDKPSDLNVNQSHYKPDTLALNISWLQPHVLPDYYTINVLDLYLNGNQSNYRVDKDTNSYYIPEVQIYGGSFQVFLTAHSLGGNTTTNEIFVKTARVVLVSDNKYVKLLFALLVPLICIAILSLSIVCTRKAKLRRYKARCKYLEELDNFPPGVNVVVDDEEQCSSLELSTMPSSEDMYSASLENIFVDNELELDAQNLLLYEVLGEGAFGLVRRGKLGDLEVAVKMLRDDPSHKDVQAFRREIEFMKSVGKHANIIGLVGHATKNLSSTMLFIEYCSLGSLLNFLRNEWKFIQENRNNKAETTKTHIEQNNDSSELNSKAKLLHYANDEVRIEEISTESPNSTTNDYDDDDVVSSISSFSPITTIEAYTLCEHLTNKSFEPKNMEAVISTAAENQSYGLESICHCVKTKTDMKYIDENELERIEEPFEQPEKNIENKSNCTQEQRSSRVFTTVENCAYFLQTEKENELPHEEKFSVSVERKPLEEPDLLNIARQVATGMEYLSKNKIVHRDLAARNVLVSADRTIKIADFGLSRDVYHENIYKKTSGGKLPVKWLAIESLTHQVYTTKSDVWSFGVLLFEIMTLGSVPYPSISAARLIQLLRNGYRMEKPDECSEEIYNIMRTCWDSTPAKRPSFGDLKQKLDSLIESDIATENGQCKTEQIEYVTSILRGTVKNDILKVDEIADRELRKTTYLQPVA